jgi:hypothetical protein
MIGALLVTAVVGDSIYYKLKNNLEDYGDTVWPYVRGTEIYGSCDASLFLGPDTWRDHEYIRDNQCVTKCKSDPDAYGCYHFMGTYSQDYAWWGYFHCLFVLQEDGSWKQDPDHYQANHPRFENGGVPDQLDNLCGNPEGKFTKGNDYLDPPQELSGYYASLQTEPFYRDPNGLLCGRPEEIASMCYYLDGCDGWVGMGLDLQTPEYYTTKPADAAGYPSVFYNPTGKGPDWAVEAHWRYPSGGVETEKMGHQRGIVARLVGPGCTVENGKLYTLWSGTCNQAQKDPDTGDITWPDSNKLIHHDTDCPQPQTDWASHVFYVAERPVSQECPLGKGLEIHDGNYPSVTGLYNMDSETLYTHVDHKHKLVSNGEYDGKACGWTLDKYTTAASGDGGSGGGGGGGSCLDDNLALNYALEQCNDPATCETSDPDYQDNICAALRSVWNIDTVTYCADTVFRSVCPASCEVDDCSVDHGTCDGTCDDPVKMKICPETCGEDARRLQTTKPAAGAYRGFLANLQKLRKGAQRRLSGPGSSGAVVDEGHFERLYDTCKKCEEECSNALDETTTVYDYKMMHTAVPGGNVSFSCSQSMTYTMEAYTYCPNENIDIKYGTDPNIVEHRCQRKCGDSTTDKETGDTLDYCSGNNATLADDDLALCLPREKCEEACNSLDDCVSIDMHRFLPRCYLNKKGACEDNADKEAATTPDDVMALPAIGTCTRDYGAGNQQYPFHSCPDALMIFLGQKATNYDLLTKVVSADEKSIVHPDDPTVSMNDDRTGWKVHSSRWCANAMLTVHETFMGNATGVGSLDTTSLPVDLFAAPLKGTWDECTTACKNWRSAGAAEDQCAGFQITYLTSTLDPSKQAYNLGTGAFSTADVKYMADDLTFAEAICEFVTYETISDGEPTCSTETPMPNPEVSTAFVQKLKYDPCVATVTGLGDVDGVYVLSDTAGTLYRTDNAAMLQFDSSVCDGWQIFTNKKMEIQELHVCSDSAEAAALYLTKAGVVWGGDFPCQWGSDMGLCDTDLAFRGLCAHTCEDLIPFTGSMGLRRAHMIEYGYPQYMEEGEEAYGSQKLDELYEGHPLFLALFSDDSTDGVGTTDGDCTDPPEKDCTDCGLPNCNEAAKSMSQCSGDNNVAMWMFVERTMNRTEWRKTWFDDRSYKAWADRLKTSCADMIGPSSPWYSAHEWPCTAWNTSSIVEALCPKTCAAVDEPEPAAAGAGSDEADPAGAAERRARRLTVSWSGKQNTTVYAHYYSRSTAKDFAYQTFPLTADDADSLWAGATYGADSSFTPGTACPSGAAFGQDAYDMLNASTTSFYKAGHGEYTATDATITPVCRGFSHCPELTTCAMTTSRMHDELHVWRYSLPDVQRHTYLAQIDGPEKEMLFDITHWIPKVLTSAERAEAIIRGNSIHTISSMWRTAPGATRLTFPVTDEVGAFMVVTMYEPEHAMRESGVTMLVPEYMNKGTEDEVLLRYFTSDNTPNYAVPYEGHLDAYYVEPYFTDWISDGIRFERFNGNKVAEPMGSFTFDMYLPGYTKEMLEDAPLIMFRFPPVAGSDVEARDITTEGGSVTILPTGKVRIHAMDIAGDFALKQDLNECSDPSLNVCDSIVGICTNRKYGYDCSCPAEYECKSIVDGDTAPEHVAPGACGKCEAKAQEHPDFYISLKHASRLDYGWRVKKVTFYEDIGCTTEVTGAGVPTSVESLEGSYPYKVSGTGADSKTKANLATAEHEWWSTCVTCNPEEVDSSHGGAATLRWTFNGASAVGCIKVEQGDITTTYGGHAASAIVVERGPVEDEHGMLGQPTMTWSATCGSGDVKGGVTDNCMAVHVPLGCGVPGTVLFGEILEPPGTEARSHYGSYGEQTALTVESACHCHELCLNYLHAGCRSYKFYTSGATPHCILQTTDFAIYKDGMVGAPGSHVAQVDDYTSGTPMDRFAMVTDSYKDFTSELTVAKPWVGSASYAGTTLTITGYGFPVKGDSKADRSRYQRVKLVASGAKCTAPVPKEVKGVGCVETTLKRLSAPGQQNPDKGQRDRLQTVHTVCATRPESGTFAEVMWSDVVIQPAASPAEYDVCYCDGRECSSPKNWVRVPGKISIPAAGYTMVADTASVPRAPAGNFSIAVSRPAFYSTVDRKDWEVKVVRSVFGCGVASPFYVHAGYPTVDSAEYDIEMDGAEVGKYVVCFREDNTTEFEPLAGELEVTYLATDRTHTRNVYREQRWSVKAGGPARMLTLAGTGLPTPSASKVVLSSGASCAYKDYSFAGSAVRQPVASDTTAPTVDWASTVPANSSTVGVSTVIVLSFNELIQTAEDCLGGFSLVDSTGVKVNTVACSDVEIHQNFVVLDFATTNENGTMYPEAGTYSITVDSYAIQDLDGNDMMRQESGSGQAYEVYLGAADTVPPMIVKSTPEQSGVFSGEVMEFIMSEPVNTSETGYMELFDCGSDYKCDDDDVQIARYAVPAYNESNNSGVLEAIHSDGRTVMITIGTVAFDLVDNRRYKLFIANGSLTDAAGNPNGDLVHEFLKDTTGFSRANVLPPTAVTDSAYTYAVQLSEDTAPGTYHLCYCDANTDETLQDTGDKGTTYTSTPGEKRTASTSWSMENSTLADDLCDAKCKAGCVGDHCHCEDFDATDGSMSTTYCLSPEKCQAACDAEADCGFFSMSGNLCVLAKDDASTVAGAAFTTFTKKMGTACTHPHDFPAAVGKITVTKRVDVGVEYVVAPGDATTVEVTGTELIKGDMAIPFSADRIMIVDCDGQCGYSAPTASASISGSWHDLPPIHWKIDKPAEVPACADKAGFSDSDGYTCADWGGDWDGNGVVDCLESQDPINFAAGYSAADMEAIRLGCPLSCDACPLTDRPIKAQIKEPEDIDWANSARGGKGDAADLLVPGSGYSTPSVLRFAPLGLPSAGTYKVCFCDSDLVDGRCSTAADYPVEIGKMHVSGLGCLLSVPKLRAATCTEQYYGGLRCDSD